MQHSSKKISLFLLVLLVVSAIDSVRNLPSAALFGPSLIFFFLFGALMFLMPVALVSAELASQFPEKGGVYHWLTSAFGEKTGMLAIWLQWINTMVWYPTILTFIAGTIAYLIDPDLVTSESYMTVVTLVVFWILTIANLFGIELSARINSFCGLVGTLLPMAFLIVLGIIWLGAGNIPKVSFSLDTIFPTLNGLENWVSLTVVMASFLGMELSGVHVNDIRDPQRNFPKAMGYASSILVASMLFGALAIACILPAEDISLVAGIMQVFTRFFDTFGMPWAAKGLAVLILIGSVGGIINWLISPAKGLLHASEYGFMPPVFQKTNKYGVAYNILLGQAVLVSLLCLIFVLVPSVNAFYWYLTALSTDLYIMMYILMFFSGIKLYKKRHAGFRIPGGRLGMWIICLMGIAGSVLSFAVSFFRPDTLEISAGKYALMILIGNLVMALPVFFFFWYRGKRKKIESEDLPSRPPGI